MSIDNKPPDNKNEMPSIEPSIVRDLIKHENDLINYRITWFITIQGLLFTALGFTWGKLDAQELIFVFCGIGVFCSISVALVLWGGASAIDQLSLNLPITKQPIIGRRAGIERYFYPWYLFPVLFGAAWGTILWINF